jgi:hypothetical protein
MNPILSVHHVVVFHNPNKWAAVPANNGANGPVWQWGDELLVGFTMGTAHLQSPNTHQCDASKPLISWLARSIDGGETWQTWKPEGYAGQPADSRAVAAGMNFASLGFVLRVEGNGYHGNSGCRWFASDDRGASWSGPYGFGALPDSPELAGLEFTGRTAYLVEGPQTLLLFLSARKTQEAATLNIALEEKPFLVRTDDGGKSWSFVSWLVPWSDTSRAVMPAPVRLSPSRLVAAVRRKSTGKLGHENIWQRYEHWIDCYASADNGATWSHLSRVGDTGESNGNPPALVAMADGRLCCVYGNRTERSMLARFSADGGATWSEPAVIRDDFSSVSGQPDLGYPRLYQRPDDKLVAVYFWCSPERPETHIAATIFKPE